MCQKQYTSKQTKNIINKDQWQTCRKCLQHVLCILQVKEWIHRYRCKGPVERSKLIREREGEKGEDPLGDILWTWGERGPRQRQTRDCQQHRVKWRKEELVAGSCWSSMFRIGSKFAAERKRRHRWNEREEPSLTREMWGKTRPLGWVLFVMVNLRRSHGAPWVTFPGSPLKLSYLTFYCLLGKEVLSNSTPSLWELFWEDSVLSLLGLGLIPGWRTKIRGQKKKKKKDLFFPLEIQKEGRKKDQSTGSS